MTGRAPGFGGDYINQRGVIEARFTSDGRGLNGTYLRADQQWSWFSFALNADGSGWQGMWRAGDLPQAGDMAWNAHSRLDSLPSALRHATGAGPFWPPTYAGPPFGNHARFVFGPEERDPCNASPTRAATWLGQYDTDIKPYAYSVSLSVEDSRSGHAPLVELAFFAPQGAAREAVAHCPKAMHPDFCRDLHSRFGPDVSMRQSLQITQLGSLVEDSRVLLAFLLSGDTAPRLMMLSRDPAGVRLRIWHPMRGLDLDSIVSRLPHLCALGGCDPHRAVGPAVVTGPLTSNSFINAYMQIPDRRAEAHAALQPLPTVPLPAVVLIEGLLELVDQNGEQIGMLDLFTESSTQVTGAGEIYPMSALAGQTFLPVDVYTDHIGVDAVQLRLDSGRGLSLPLLLRPRKDGTWAGTLIRDGRWELITLSDGGGMFDTPSIGVFGPNYTLRNTAGQSALLRAEPRSEAPSVGQIAASVRNLLVLGCQPDVDSLRWEQSGHSHASKCWMACGAKCAMTVRCPAGYRVFFCPLFPNETAPAPHRISLKGKPVDNLFRIIIFAGFALMLGGFILQSRKHKAARAQQNEALRSLATARGMQFETEGDTASPTTPIRLVDRANALTLRLVPRPESSRQGPGGAVELSLQHPTFSGGLAIYAHHKNPDLARAISVLSGALNNPLARKALTKTMGGVLGPDVLDNLGDLQAFEAANDAPLLILASIDPESWFNSAAIAKAIADGPRTYRQKDPRLLITVSASGTTLRATPVSLEPEAIAKLLDLALELQANMPNR